MVTIPPLAEATLLLALILGMTAGAIYGVRKWINRASAARHDASDMLSEFRDLHARGGLSDNEYRTIKTKLAPELQGEAPGNAAIGPATE